METLNETMKNIIEMKALLSVSEMTVEDWKKYGEEFEKEITKEDEKIAMEYEQDKEISLNSLNNI